MSRICQSTGRGVSLYLIANTYTMVWGSAVSSQFSIQVGGNVETPQNRRESTPAGGVP